MTTPSAETPAPVSFWRRMGGLFSRKLTWRQSLTTLFVLATSLYLWMRFEATWLRVREEAVAIPAWNGQRPLKIVLMSDFHLDYFDYGYLERTVNLVLAQKPDLVLLGGDFGTPNVPEPEIEFLLHLGNLAHAVPTYACLGNHDHGLSFSPDTTIRNPPVASLLEEAGVKVLRNARVDLEVAGGRLVLASVGEIWANDMDPERCLEREAAFAAAPLTLLLAHNPDCKEAVAAFHWDLLCSGHTHAGQGVIPFVTPHVPTADSRYIHGLYELGAEAGALPGHRRFLAVTAGVGALYGIRFNCRPEIMVLTISGAKAGNPDGR